MRGSIYAATTALALAAAGCTSLPMTINPTVEANPHNVLSAWVCWTTDQPMTSRVDFSHDGSWDFFVEDDEMVTEHRLLVYGMRPETAYTFNAWGTDEDGTTGGGGEVSYTTPITPFGDLVTEVDVLQVNRMEPGWTLTNLLVADVLYPATAVMFDAEGYPVWYHQYGGPDSRADIEVTLVDGDRPRVLFGGSLEPERAVAEVDLTGEITWEGPEQPNSLDPAPDGAYHHSFRKLADGTYLGLHYEWDGNQLYDVVQQFDAGGDTVWSWEARDLPHAESAIYPWGNAPLMDLDAGAAYYNTRGNSALYKVDMASGDVDWVLGEEGDFVGDFAGDPDHPQPWFAEAHGPQLQANGNILMYDNGTPQRAASRALELAIDEQAMTAEVVWEYPGEGVDDSWFTVHMGDADRLANGNTLINVGHLVPGGSPSRIFEVSPDGDVVWQLWLSAEDGQVAGGFSAERIPVLVGEL
jgi:hypothetical protein